MDYKKGGFEGGEEAFGISFFLQSTSTKGFIGRQGFEMISTIVRPTVQFVDQPRMPI